MIIMATNDELIQQAKIFRVVTSPSKVSELKVTV